MLSTHLYFYSSSNTRLTNDMEQFTFILQFIFHYCQSLMADWKFWWHVYYHQIPCGW